MGAEERNWPRRAGHGTYNHVFMPRIRNYLGGRLDHNKLVQRGIYELVSSKAHHFVEAVRGVLRDGGAGTSELAGRRPQQPPAYLLSD